MGEVVWGAILAWLILCGLTWPHWNRKDAVPPVDSGKEFRLPNSAPLVGPLSEHDPWPPLVGQQVRLGIAGKARVTTVVHSPYGIGVNLRVDGENMELAMRGKPPKKVKDLVDGSLKNLIDQVEKGEGRA